MDDNANSTTAGTTALTQRSEWANKVLAILKGGNAAGALAQIKVAPSPKDLKLLQKALVEAGLTGRWADVDVAIRDNIDALSAPRLHRSP